MALVYCGDIKATQVRAQAPGDQPQPTGHEAWAQLQAVVNYKRERHRLNEQIAATSDEAEKSDLTKRLSEVEKHQLSTDSMNVWAREPQEACTIASSQEFPTLQFPIYFFGLLVQCRGIKSR